MPGSEKTEIDFGTSGLRAAAINFTQENISAYVGAFLELFGDADKKIVYVGADLRLSSPNIAANVIAAINAKGWQSVYGGNVPTPALAFYAMERNCPAIMITGSHIPEDYNGIKFYSQKGELLKEDEAPIRQKAMFLLQEVSTTTPMPLPEIDRDIANAYVTRFASGFSNDILKGVRLGVDMHSAVGRDLTVQIMRELGAICFPFHRSEKFIAVDTEALNKEYLQRAAAQIKKHKLDAIISTDGDGDRPLLLDENGNQVNGDILGALTAKALGINIVVTPLSSTSAIEKSGWFNKVERTKIGSPYVVSAMEKEQGTKAGALIAGFEANGGFLLASDLTLSNGTISKLPTRDAILPLIMVLAEAVKQDISISGLVKSMPGRFMKADRIKNISSNNAQIFLSGLKNSKSTRDEIHLHISEPLSIDELDGVRMSFADETIVHFRQSGNAPEMRIYVETDAQDFTDSLLSEVIESLKKYFAKKGFLNY